MTEEGSPVDRLLDLAFYAPVGLALAALEGLPHWAEIGRRQVETRLNAARVVGRLAVDQGSRQGGEVLRRVAEQADKAMSGLGMVPDKAGGRQPGSGPEPNAGAGPEPHVGPGPGSAASEPVVPPIPSPSAGSAPVGLDPAQLAIPGYDTLSASQVVQRLPGLSPDELEAVRLYELAGRARKTVLLKAAQLHNGP